ISAIHSLTHKIRSLFMASQLETAKAAAIDLYFAPAEPSGLATALAVSTRPRQNVTGVGIGRKIKGGADTGRDCVRIYVERKVPADGLTPEDRLPASIAGVETDVIETGRLTAFIGVAASGFTGRRRLRPAEPGCSIGFQLAGGAMAGTFGALVR